MEEYIKILEKSIRLDEISGGSYISVEIPREFREKEINAIKQLLQEVKKERKNNTSGGIVICLI